MVSTSTGLKSRSCGVIKFKLPRAANLEYEASGAVREITTRCKLSGIDSRKILVVSMKKSGNSSALSSTQM